MTDNYHYTVKQNNIFGVNGDFSFFKKKTRKTSHQLVPAMNGSHWKVPLTEIGSNYLAPLQAIL